MLTAVILVKSTRDGLTRLGPELADIEGVAEVYTVTGEWDFIAIARVREHEELAQVVTTRLTQLDGIKRTRRSVACRHSRPQDLDAMWGLGMKAKQPGPIAPRAL